MAESREISREEDSSGSDNDLGTDAEELAGPPEPKQSRKHSGAAMYRTKFNPDWKKEFPFIISVSKDPYRYVYCSFAEGRISKVHYWVLAQGRVELGGRYCDTFIIDYSFYVYYSHFGVLFPTY